MDGQGGAIEEYRVDVDPAKLAAHGLAESEVKSLSPRRTPYRGRPTGRSLPPLPRVANSRFKSTEDLKSVLLRAGSGGGIVRLRMWQPSDRRNARNRLPATADGRDAVLFHVFQQPRANTIQIAAGICEAISDE